MDSRTKRRWMMAGAAVGIAAVIALVVAVAALPRGSSVNLNPNHVVVAVFRNETGDPSLDQLGSRAGHWVTQGIQKAAIPVTPWDIALQSWEYVQAEVEAGRVRDPITALAEESGAGIVVSGTMYILGSDSLEIQTNVTDARRGRLLGTLDPVRGPRESDSRLLSDVQERVMAFLSIRFEELVRDWVPDLVAEPPSFEAQQEYAVGFRQVLVGQNEAAIPHLKRAFELDSTFVVPLLRLISAYGNLGRAEERDSVIRLIEGLGDRLTPFERATVEARRLADQQGDNEAALRAFRRAAELAPGSPEYLNCALRALRANRPRLAVDMLSGVDPERHFLGKTFRYWYWLISAHQMLGELEEALEAVQRGRRLHPEAIGLIRNHALALAALGRIEEMNEVLDELESSGAVGNFRFALRETPEWLRYYGYTDAAIAVAERAINWLETRSIEDAATSSHRLAYGRVLFLAGRLDEAQAVLDALVEEFPNNRDARIWRAFVAARRGDTTQALSDADALENLAERLEGVERNAARWWSRGVIYGALGHHERAMGLFRQFQSQWPHGEYDHITVLYEPMRDYEPFQEFLRPKG